MPSLVVPAVNLLEAQERVLQTRGGVVLREMPERRTMNSKTMLLDSGKRHLSHRIGPVHYQDDPSAPMGEGWDEIDLTPVRVAGGWRIQKAFYDVFIPDGRPGFQYRSKRGPLTTIELESVDGREPDMSAMQVRVVDNQVLFDNVDPDLDMKVLLRQGYAEIFKAIKTPAAARQFRWRVTEDANDEEQRPARFDRKTLGVEKRAARAQDTGRMEIANRVLGEQLRGNRREFTFEEAWSGRVSRIADARTRRRGWFDDPVYPVIVDASVTENIAANVDDGHGINVEPGFWFSQVGTTTLYWKGGHASFSYHPGLRYRSVAIPSGATIDSGTITLNVLAIAGSPSLKLYGDDVDDAALWSGSNRPDQITKTTANVAVAPSATGTGYTINVKDVVAEIVARVGWASGADQRFGILNQVTAGTHLVAAEDYADAGSNEAQLDVTYSTLAVPVMYHHQAEKWRKR